MAGRHLGNLTDQGKTVGTTKENETSRQVLVRREKTSEGRATGGGEGGEEIV